MVILPSLSGCSMDRQDINPQETKFVAKSRLQQRCGHYILGGDPRRLVPTVLIVLQNNAKTWGDGTSNYLVLLP